MRILFGLILILIIVKMPRKKTMRKTRSGYSKKKVSLKNKNKTRSRSSSKKKVSRKNKTRSRSNSKKKVSLKNKKYRRKYRGGADMEELNPDEEDRANNEYIAALQEQQRIMDQEEAMRFRWNEMPPQGEYDPNYVEQGPLTGEEASRLADEEDDRNIRRLEKQKRERAAKLRSRNRDRKIGDVKNTISKGVGRGATTAFAGCGHLTGEAGRRCAKRMAALVGPFVDTAHAAMAPIATSIEQGVLGNWMTPEGRNASMGALQDAADWGTGWQASAERFRERE